VHLLAGLGLGFSLIVAIGAQNLFVLRQGIRREHVLLVATLCAASDAVLIAAGVAGIGAATSALPWLVHAVRWAGALFLIGYGLLAARRAWRPAGEVLTTREADAAGRGVEAGASGADRGGRPGVATAARAAAPAGAVAATCLALTWLNPHVYLDTVFLVGSVAGSHGDGRWEFAAGAMLASLAWFFGLAYGGRLLGRWLASVRAWRVLDALIAVVMTVLGVSLAAG